MIPYTTSNQCSDIIDREALENVGEAGLEINRLGVEDTQTENVPYKQDDRARNKCRFLSYRATLNTFKLWDYKCINLLMNLCHNTERYILCQTQLVLGLLGCDN